MNASQIHTSYKLALQHLAKGQLKAAFEKINSLVDELQIGDYKDKLSELQQNYQFLLHYYSTGAEDPQQKSVYNKLIAKTFQLSNDLREELLLRNSTSYEYLQKRYFPHSKRYNSATELLISLKYFHSQYALIANLGDTHEVEFKRLRSNYETALNELFSMYWLASSYQVEDKNVFTKLMHLDHPGSLEKTTLVAALTMNLWRMFDESKLLMLLDACQHQDQRIKQRALVGLCFVLAKHNRFLTYFPSIRNRLVLLADDNHVVENIQNIIIQIIGTAETDKISKKMQEEILPEMMKISPKLRDGINSENLLSTDEWNEENPQWQDLLNESGVAETLKELSELQMEGADVYMSTFSLLKNFAFFDKLSNWFLPFDGKHSSVNELFKPNEKSMLTAFVSNNIMCNSDKYSFCLSILQMSEFQRNLLKQSFVMEAEQLDEMTKDEAVLTPDISAKNTSKQYIQDLFRFFKLYPQRADFSNMFSYSLTLHRTFLFDIMAGNKDFKINIGEYYFSKNHYLQALELFEALEPELVPTAALYQKIGYSYQQTSNYAKALDAYLKADIIQPDDLWTIRKLAICYKLSSNFAKSLEYYLHAEFIKPNQKSVLMQIGHCYLELGKYKEALSQYYKLEALEEEDPRIWRALSWCSLLTGSLSQADYYMQKILDDKPTSTDYLNAGHIAWCAHKRTEAINYYKICLELLDNNMEVFRDMLTTDASYLIANGIDRDEFPLMIDALLSPDF